MDFSSVYKILQDVFPQVDSRALRAVAIEHAKDADAAVEVVLLEVIPYLSQKPKPVVSSDGNVSSIDPSQVVVESEDTTVKIEDSLPPDSSFLYESVTATYYDDSIVNEGAQGDDSIDCGLTSIEKCNESDVCFEASSSVEVTACKDDAGSNHHESLQMQNVEAEPSLSSVKFPTVNEFTSQVVNLPSDLEILESSVASTGNHCESLELQNVEALGVEFPTISELTSQEVNLCSDLENLELTVAYKGNHHESLELQNVEAKLSLSTVELPTIPESTSQEVNLPNGLENLEPSVAHKGNHHESLELQNGEAELSLSTVEFPTIPELTSQKVNLRSTDLENLELSVASNGNRHDLIETQSVKDVLSPSTVEFPTVPEFTHPELNLPSTDLENSEPSGASKVEMMHTVVSNRSSQICSSNLLDEIIEDARSNKKILVLAMESVIGLMKEVEVQERAAEKAKEEAAQGGLDILCKVEELKQQLRLAKEANDMHAGEIYGEKAILATEMRELQSRLRSLSDRRDKSLEVLDEMRQILELRLTAAGKEREVAVQEKEEKEEAARNLLNTQNMIMEKVVQESKILKQAAEENSKLRDFLIDRGHVIDILQGEINVKCQDVKLLKERFDEGVPVSKFLSTSQTSSISSLLASSRSSLRSSEALPKKVIELSENPKKKTETISIDSDLSSEDEKTNDDVEVFLAGEERIGRVSSVDDGWELFRNEMEGKESADAAHALAGDDVWELFRGERTSLDYNKMFSEDGWELFNNREHYK